MMIKYIIVILSLIVFSGMDIVEIDENLYVVSMGVDYDEETSETEITLYFVASASIVNSSFSKDDDAPATATFKGYNEIEILRRIETTHNQTFQFTHMASYILTNTYIENVGFSKIIDSLILNPRRHPNFYVFATDNEIKDVYEHKNIDNISTYYSIIFNPIQIYKQHTEIDVKHITEIISEYYEGTLYPEIPLVRINDQIWQDDGEQLKTIELYGYCYDKEDYQCLDIYNNRGIKYSRNSVLFIETFEEYNIKVKNLKVNLSNSDNIIVINISLDTLILSNPNLIDEDIIINQFKEYINEEIKKVFKTNIDVFRIEDYMYRNQILNYNGFIIRLNIKSV